MRFKLLAFGIILGYMVTLAPGCEEPSIPGEFPDHFMINYTADNHGALFPCGCRIPLGGLSRRGGVLVADSPYPQLTVDAGSFSGGTTGYDRFTAGYILLAYVEMGYDVVNLGVRESVQPISQIQDWDSMSGGILISANLIDNQDLPVTRKYLIREIDGIRVGITGITAQGHRPVDASSMPTALLPVPALLEVMDEFEEENIDFVILLADAVTDEISAILAEVPGIDLVIQAQEFNPSSVPASQYIEESDTYLVRIGGSGKYLGRMRIDFDTEGIITNDEVIRIDLSMSTPILSSISELLTEFKIQVRERREEFLGDPANPFQMRQSPELIDLLTGYTGQAFCRECHLGYDMEQQIVGHETAWDILDEAGRRDPECLECHTTGFGVPTGMEDPFRDSHLRGVSCEACHGPAALHVRERKILSEDLDESEMLAFDDPTGLPFTTEVPEEVCIRCHTEEWSPDFDYDTWVQQIIHSVATRGRRQNRFQDTDEPVMPDIDTDLIPPSPD